MSILFSILVLMFSAVAHAQYYDCFSDGNITKNPQWFTTCIDAKVMKFNGINAMDITLSEEPDCNEGSIRTPSFLTSDTEWHCCVSVECGGQNTHFIDYFIASSLPELGSAQGIFVRVDTRKRQLLFVSSNHGAESVLASSPEFTIPEGHTKLELSISNKAGRWLIECSADGAALWTGNVTHIPDHKSLTSGVRIVEVGSGCTPHAVVWKICCGDTAELNNSIAEGNLAITEIMSDPSPQKGLPDVEWIEIFNRTDITLSLSGCVISSSAKNGFIARGAIKAGEYALLCSWEAFKKLAGVVDGNIIIADGMPVLRNEGDRISLYNGRGGLIAAAEYNGKWTNADGGISLEKRDVDYPIDNSDNWGASLDPAGGTPCRKNSIESYLTDSLQPAIIGVAVADGRHITLVFNKPMADDYEVAMAAEPLISAMSSSAASLVNLTLSEPLDSMRPTNIFLSGLYCISGFLLPDTVISLALPRQVSGSDLIINEIMPYVNDEQTKFVELLNNSDKYICIGDIRLCSPVADKDGYRCKPVAGMPLILSPRQLAVVAADADNLHCRLGRNRHSVYISASLPSLPAKGGKLLVVNACDEVVDSLDYSSDMHHPALRDVRNVSLERMSPTAQTNAPGLWQSATEECGYNTAGWDNSQRRAHNSVSRPLFSCDNPQFSPNNDGYADCLEIKYSMPESGCLLTADVYTRSGQRVCRFINNQILSRSGSIAWNGTDQNGSINEDGVYVILLRVTTPGGKVISQRLTVVKF